MNKPLRNDGARFVTPEMAKGRYNLCRKNIIKLAKESGALVKYGRAVRIDVEKMDAYLIDEYAEV